MSSRDSIQTEESKRSRTHSVASSQSGSIPPLAFKSPSPHEILTNVEARARNAALICTQETLGNKIGQRYLESEVLSLADDFMLLEQMNALTTSRLKQLQETIVEPRMIQQATSLQQAYASLDSVTGYIPELQDEVDNLEQVCKELERYVTRVEAYVKSGVKKTSRFW